MRSSAAASLLFSSGSNACWVGTVPHGARLGGFSGTIIGLTF
jgi:hypothetical protein